MTLPYDVSRCAARYGYDEDSEWCPRRDTCHRYLAFVQLDRDAGVPDYRGVSVLMAHEPCEVYLPHEPLIFD